MSRSRTGHFRKRVREELPEPDRIEHKYVHGQLVPVKVYRSVWAQGSSVQTHGRISNRGRPSARGDTAATERTLGCVPSQETQSISALLDAEYDGRAMAKRHGHKQRGESSADAPRHERVNFRAGARGNTRERSHALRPGRESGDDVRMPNGNERRPADPTGSGPRAQGGTPVQPLSRPGPGSDDPGPAPTRHRDPGSDPSSPVDCLDGLAALQGKHGHAASS